jgi:hypothetical protein
MYPAGHGGPERHESKYKYYICIYELLVRFILLVDCINLCVLLQSHEIVHHKPCNMHNDRNARRFRTYNAKPYYYD